MSDLMNLPNVGKVLCQNLKAVGIETPAQLEAIGAKEAFLRIRSAVDSGACLHMLYGLEGACRGVHDSLLPEDVTSDLKAFFRQVEKGAG